MNLTSSQKDVIATILAVVVLVGIFILAKEPNNDQESITPAAAYFIEQTRNTVISELGQPIEGFEQSMFMTVYPGLQGSDFANVETIGDLNEADVATSADAAITDYGMTILLSNVAERLDISIDNEQDVNEILKSISANEDITQGEINLEGVTTCLPHKDTTGPQTLECAFGLQTDSGANYALDLSAFSPDSMSAISTTNNRIRVSGIFVPVEVLSSMEWHKYDIEGIIRVNNAVEI
jgi:hypothetical protein